MVDSIPTTTVAAERHAGRPGDRAARLARRDALRRVRPGVYAEPVDWDEAPASAKLRTRIDAAQAAARGPLVFSHESAALLLKIPLIGEVPTRPHVLVAPDTARSGRHVQRTERAVDGDRVVDCQGLLVTDALDTAIDLAATRSPLGGAIAFAHVRRHHGVTFEAAAEAIRARRPFRGVRFVERALANSTDGSDSPLEALVWVRCRDLGFARPEQQREYGIDGRTYRVDFAWDDGRIVLEADGHLKYTDAAILDGRAPGEAVVDEKLREDRIRELGVRFGRTIWSEAWRGAALERTLLRLGVPRLRPAGRLTF